jgi:trigger factor
MRVQNKSMAQLREELEPQAADRIRHALLLTKIIDLEGLDVSQEEVSAQVEEMSSRWGARADDARATLTSDSSQRMMRNRLLTDKAIQRLVAIARGEAPDRPESDQ